MKIPRLSFNIHEITLQGVKAFAWRHWVKSFRYLIVLCILWGLLHVGSLWYKNIYSTQITQEQKDQEIELKKNRVRFRKEEFTKINEAIEKKKILFEQNGENSRDMFFPSAQESIIEEVPRAQNVLEKSAPSVVLESETSGIIEPETEAVDLPPNETLSAEEISEQNDEEAPEEDSTETETETEALSG